MIVFLHGVPETAALWDKVRARLGGETMALALPGFGCPRPAGFGATKDEYVAWILGQLDLIDEPVDLVGHDWGAAFTYRIATAHGDRLRSWSADVANILHPEYQWHDLARVWQTPDEGEAFFRNQGAAPAEARAGVFEMWGVEHDDAVKLASWSDPTMAACILDLYRSALPNPYADWSVERAATAAPGLVLCPADDPFGDQTLSRQVAETVGARHQVLDGVGHWWPLQAPAASADVLREFLHSVR